MEKNPLSGQQLQQYFSSLNLIVVYLEVRVQGAL